MMSAHPRQQAAQGHCEQAGKRGSTTTISVGSRSSSRRRTTFKSAARGLFCSRCQYGVVPFSAPLVFHHAVATSTSTTHLQAPASEQVQCSAAPRISSQVDEALRRYNFAFFDELEGEQEQNGSRGARATSVAPQVFVASADQNAFVPDPVLVNKFTTRLSPLFQKSLLCVAGEHFDGEAVSHLIQDGTEVIPHQLLCGLCRPGTYSAELPVRRLVFRSVEHLRAITREGLQSLRAREAQRLRGGHARSTSTSFPTTGIIDAQSGAGVQTAGTSEADEAFLTGATVAELQSRLTELLTYHGVSVPFAQQFWSVYDAGALRNAGVAISKNSTTLAGTDISAVWNFPEGLHVNISWSTFDTATINSSDVAEGAVPGRARALLGSFAQESNAPTATAPDDGRNNDKAARRTSTSTTEDSTSAATRSETSATTSSIRYALDFFPACTNCGPDQVTAFGQGSTTATACICKNEYFWDRRLATCRRCVVGMRCDWGAAVSRTDQETIIAKPGYKVSPWPGRFSSHNREVAQAMQLKNLAEHVEYFPEDAIDLNGVTLFKCGATIELPVTEKGTHEVRMQEIMTDALRTRCPGGVQVCGDHHQGLTCRKCASYAGYNGKVCSPCNESAWKRFVLDHFVLSVVIMFFLTCFMLVLTYILTVGNDVTSKASPAVFTGAFVGMTVQTFQTLAVFSSMKVSWPDAVQGLFAGMRTVFLLELHEIGLGFECFASGDSFRHYLARIMMPFTVFALYFGAYWITRRRQLAIPKSFSIPELGGMASVSRNSFTKLIPSAVSTRQSAVMDGGSGARRSSWMSTAGASRGSLWTESLFDNFQAVNKEKEAKASRARASQRTSVLSMLSEFVTSTANDLRNSAMARFGGGRSGARATETNRIKSLISMESLELHRFEESASCSSDAVPAAGTLPGFPGAVVDVGVAPPTLLEQEEPTENDLRSVPVPRGGIVEHNVRKVVRERDPKETWNEPATTSASRQIDMRRSTSGDDDLPNGIREQLATAKSPGAGEQEEKNDQQEKHGGMTARTLHVKDKGNKVNCSFSFGPILQDMESRKVDKDEDSMKPDKNNGSEAAPRIGALRTTRTNQLQSLPGDHADPDMALHLQWEGEHMLALADRDVLTEAPAPVPQPPTTRRNALNPAGVFFSGQFLDRLRAMQLGMSEMPESDSSDDDSSSGATNSLVDELEKNQKTGPENSWSAPNPTAITVPAHDHRGPGHRMLARFSDSMEALWQRVRKELVYEKVFCCCGFFAQAFYISFAALGFVPFVCFYHPGSDLSSMDQYEDVLCSWDDPQFPKFVIAAVFAILLWPVGLMAAAVHLIRVAPERSMTDPKFLMKTKFLFFRFRPERYYWSLVLSTRSLLTVLSIVVGPDLPSAQITWMFLLLLTALVLQMRCWPWKDDTLNMVDTTLLIVLLLLLVVSFPLIPVTEQERETFREVLSQLCFCFLILLGILFLYGCQLLFEAWQRKYNMRTPWAIKRFHKLSRSILRRDEALFTDTEDSSSASSDEERTKGWRGTSAIGDKAGAEGNKRESDHRRSRRKSSKKVASKPRLTYTERRERQKADHLAKNWIETNSAILGTLSKDKFQTFVHRLNYYDLRAFESVLRIIQRHISFGNGFKTAASQNALGTGSVIVLRDSVKTEAGEIEPDAAENEGEKREETAARRPADVATPVDSTRHGSSRNHQLQHIGPRDEAARQHLPAPREQVGSIEEHEEGRKMEPQEDRRQPDSCSVTGKILTQKNSTSGASIAFSSTTEKSADGQLHRDFGLERHQQVTETGVDHGERALPVPIMESPPRLLSGEISSTASAEMQKHTSNRFLSSPFLLPAPSESGTSQAVSIPVASCLASEDEDQNHVSIAAQTTSIAADKTDLGDVSNENDKVPVPQHRILEVNLPKKIDAAKVLARRSTARVEVPDLALLQEFVVGRSNTTPSRGDAATMKSSGDHLLAPGAADSSKSVSYTYGVASEIYQSRTTRSSRRAAQDETSREQSQRTSRKPSQRTSRRSSQDLAAALSTGGDENEEPGLEHQQEQGNDNSTTRVDVVVQRNRRKSKSSTSSSRSGSPGKQEERGTHAQNKSSSSSSANTSRRLSGVEQKKLRRSSTESAGVLEALAELISSCNPTPTSANNAGFNLHQTTDAVGGDSPGAGAVSSSPSNCSPNHLPFRRCSTTTVSSQMLEAINDIMQSKANNSRDDQGLISQRSFSNRQNNVVLASDHLLSQGGIAHQEQQHGAVDVQQTSKSTSSSKSRRLSKNDLLTHLATRITEQLSSRAAAEQLVSEDNTFKATSPSYSDHTAATAGAAAAFKSSRKRRSSTKGESTSSQAAPGDLQQVEQRSRLQRRDSLEPQQMMSKAISGSSTSEEKDLLVSEHQDDQPPLSASPSGRRGSSSRLDLNSISELTTATQQATAGQQRDQEAQVQKDIRRARSASVAFAQSQQKNGMMKNSTAAMLQQTGNTNIVL
ncbi:unnamed protein product [Amoebophrya sp. A120]|nr:unnamed protein product [Amoebophrya sp. A120]|eukprot:GSA120T00017432001.1